MPDRVKLSIVIPAYNSEKYIGTAVSSALAQNVPDTEVLVVNNASTDRTAEVVASFSDPRVRCVTHETNMGMVPNFRSGLEAARGKYISFLCADDVYIPDTLQRLVELLDGKPSAVVAFGNVNYIDDSGRVTGEYRPPIPPEMDGREYALLSLKTARNYMYLSSVVLRRDTLIKCGGIEAEDGIFFDWNMWLRLSLCGTVLHYDHVVLNYRSHPENESKKITLPSKRVLEVINGTMGRGLRRPDLANALAAAHLQCYYVYSNNICSDRLNGLSFSEVISEILFFARRLRPLDLLAVSPYMAASLLPVPVLNVMRRCKHALFGRKTA